jgi:alanyl-tRNA synthetase
VFYDFGDDKQDVEKYGLAHPASDGARFMEIGNQVFMQYRRLEDGSFEELKNKNVDFGGGLERIAAAAIGSFDVFKTSLMRPIIEKLEEISGKSYDNNTDEMRVIADHIRGAYLLAAQGLAPSNKTQGYAMRRIVRRAILRALDLGISQNFLSEIVPIVADNYKDLPDSILTHRDIALETLLKEERAFRQTLNKGLKELGKMTKNSKILDGRDLFKLQDTYGFPLELSIEECYRQGIELSKDHRAEFGEALKEQRERSQTASKGMFKGGLEDHGEQTVKYHTACHLMLAALQKHVDKSICQKGSNITAERVRFDFNLDHKMTPEEITAVEKQVNEWIEADLPVVFDEYDKKYARDTLKAHGEFWDKYPEKLKVYTIGDFDNPVSREVCGGPHVEHTGVIGKFHIKKEESSSAGIRRIKAVLE